MNKEIKNKRILVLGGSYSTKRVVEYSHEAGLYVIVACQTGEGEAAEIADEIVKVDMADHDAMLQIIKEYRIDGIMTGASEFHLFNMIQLCNKAGLPCYCTEEQWNICQNKQSFKNLCRQYGVPCVEEFSQHDDPNTFKYPVIVKPTDGCSARGISVCENPEQYAEALKKALGYSNEKKVIVEKYIQNGGTTMSVRYIVRARNLYLEAVGDRYVLDQEKGKALITAAAFYPSKHTDYYIKNVDSKVKAMFKGIELENGALFMEACFVDGEVYFYEMGLRISGGMTYLITEKTNDVNELRMLIRHAVTGEMCSEDETKKIDPYLNGNITASLCIPLHTGKITKVQGVEELKQLQVVNSFTQYYHEGDVIEQKHIGTLDQLFARISVIVKSKKELSDFIDQMVKSVRIEDENGQQMFITSKLENIHTDYMS